MNEALISQVREALGLLARGEDLPEVLATLVFNAFFEGALAPEVVGALLMGFATKQESLGELVAAVRVFRALMRPLVLPTPAVDCCGTGGDGLGTYNISTACAILAASCGVPIAKHGNRAASSRSGASDVLSALGLPLERSAEQLVADFARAGITYLAAPLFHASLTMLAPLRRTLGIRTLFNLVGPLSNPAGVKRQLLGVARADKLALMAQALQSLGAERALVVHGAGGLDEMSTLGPTQMLIVTPSSLTPWQVDAQDYGLARARIEDIQGGEAQENAQAIRTLFGKAPSTAKEQAYKDIVLWNAAGVLWVAQKADSLADALAQARAALESGKAQATLNNWIHA
jgi:anthranilate phosphoribosyltransferase